MVKPWRRHEAALHDVPEGSLLGCAADVLLSLLPVFNIHSTPSPCARSSALMLTSLWPSVPIPVTAWMQEVKK